MKLKYSPCFSTIDTQFRYINENEIEIDGKTYSFDPACVSWPTIAQDTDGAILSATRDSNGELHLTVRRFYTGDCSGWGDGKEHDLINPVTEGMDADQALAYTELDKDFPGVPNAST